MHASRVLVVDGNSCDQTVEIAKELGVDIFLQEGKGDAISQAIRHIDENVEYVVLTDDDYTYPAEYVPEMINMLKANPEIGMVCGNRFNGKVDEKTLHSRFYVGNKMLSFTYSLLMVWKCMTL